MKNGNQGDGGGRPATEFDQDQINLVEKLAPNSFEKEVSRRTKRVR
jgi:hypothetical protein